MKYPNYCIPIICLLAVALFLPNKATSQDAEFVLNEMRNMQLMRWEGVENYTITLSVRDAAGLETSTYHHRTEQDGEVMFIEVPRPLYEREMHIRAGHHPPEDVARGLAYGYELAGPVLASQGYPMGGMMVQGADFLRAGAAAMDSMSDGREEAMDDWIDLQEFRNRARLVGTEEVAATSGSNPTMREAYHLVADELFDIEMDQPKDGGKFTLERIDLWVDLEQMVPLILKMSGQMEQDNTLTSLTISKLDLDYHQDGPLYESHTKVYQLSGMMKAMSPKEQREMEKAMEDLARAKEQMENMTPEQKAMMEKMGMGGKIEQLEKMLEEDKIESIVDVTSIAINEGPPTPYGMGTLNGMEVMTMAGTNTGANGEEVAELVVTSGPTSSLELTVGLYGTGSFADPPEGLTGIMGASGHMVRNGKEIAITGATGKIMVEIKTQTRIAGIYEATLFYEGGSADIGGTFDSGAPVEEGNNKQPLRGSPVPGWYSDLE